MSEAVLLIDYENVQKVDLSRVPSHVQVRVFIGASQSKMPTELMMQAQPLGSRLKWIRIDGQGSNALDFHIAFYLGEFITASPKTEYVILSKDRGFDPLIRHLAGRKINVRRVSTLAEAFSASTPAPAPAPTAATTASADSYLQKARAMLGKIEKKKRPRKRPGLVAFLAAHFANKLPIKDVEALVKKLFDQKAISELNDSLTYHF